MINWKKILLFLFVLLLPTQLGRHFWFDFSSVDGIRVDYLSLIVYLTDIVVFFLFLQYFPLLFQKLKNFFSNKRRLIFLFLLLGFVFANTFLSLSPLLTIYKWVRILEFAFVVFVFVYEPTITKRLLTIGLGLGVIYVAILTVTQFLTGHFIGGWWWFLGERNYYSFTPGIANTFYNGTLLLRPYGTFSHPNTMAGFLGAIGLMFYAVYLWEICGKKNIDMVYRLFVQSVLVLVNVSIFLTFSRISTFFYLAALLFIVFVNAKKRGVILFLIACVFILKIILPRGILGIENTENIQTRISLNQTASYNFIQSPFFGKGLGTNPMFKREDFDNNYALRNQPAHSIYFISLSEVGIVVTVIWIFLLTKLIFLLIRKREMMVIPLLFIFFTGMFDHYWFTSQQGWLLFAVVVGLAVREEKR